ncbi:MAG: DUF362 domain-containing protein [Methanosphaera sp.]|nr:DUF362 domain-containing protein [Methanosphaera sp.]
MTSKVFFMRITDDDEDKDNAAKLNKLFDKSDFINNLEEDDKIAIKTHFGERGNTTYLNPAFSRKIVDILEPANVKAFLTDTNTLYHHYRTNSVDHLETANRHGYTYSVLNAPVIIADGLNGNNEVEVEINQELFKKVKIAGDIYESDGLIVLSHFKGHCMCGFGGAIKNLAMGCASRNGKKDQHRLVKPIISKVRCLACKVCEQMCPEEAITVTSHAIIDSKKCIGCNDCIDVCPVHIIKLNRLNSDEFCKALSEYALGSIINKKFNKVVYINFLTNITPDCDCNNFEQNIMMDDIGILLSYDPVAIDKASYDLVNRQEHGLDSLFDSDYVPGEDKFKRLYRNIDSTIQIKEAEKLRLGTQDYELIEVM